MNDTLKIPLYGKVALIFVSAFALLFLLYIGQSIIIPVLYATILAILLNPVVNYLVRMRINKLVAISLTVGFAIVVVLGIIYILSIQIASFSESYPQLKEKFNATSANLTGWVSDTFRIRESKLNGWAKEMQSNAIGRFMTGENLTEAGRMLVIGMLLPVYLFMILYYKPLFLEFINRLFRPAHHATVNQVLLGSKKIIQSYLVGLSFEVVIMAVLNSIGLLLLGIEYAIILGVIGAILNIIPYIGGIIGIALPMAIAFVTKDSLMYPLLVFLVYLFIQFIDNNYVIPKVVASRVQLNAFISVLVVLIGGAMWGISGMFLSIPLTAIIKVIFDHIEPLKPWGFLLGNVVPTTSRFSFLRKRATLRISK